MAADFTRGPANVDNIIASTLNDFKDKRTEQWVRNNVLLKELNQSMKDMFSGGLSLVEKIDYAANDTVAWVGKTGTVATTENQFLTDARFPYATIAGSIVLYDHDVARNTGENQIFSLAKAKSDQLDESFNYNLESALLASSTPNTDTIYSIYDIIDASDPSLASFGDISRTDYTWWAATETASGPFATQGIEDIRTASNTVGRSGMDPVDLHLTTQTIYEKYMARLTTYERFVNKTKGDLEFDSLAFGNKPVKYSFAAQSGTWLGINTKYLKFRINSNMNFLQQPWVRGKGEQFKSMIVQTMCQLVCRRPKSNFKLTGLS